MLRKIKPIFAFANIQWVEWILDATRSIWKMIPLESITDLSKHLMTIHSLKFARRKAQLQ